MFKDIVTCFKLIPYGKKFKMNMALGIICAVISIPIYIFSLIEQDTSTASFYPAFLLFEGMTFLTQPVMNIAQRGGLTFAPLRRAADIYYQPLCLIMTATLANLIWGVSGCIIAASRPEASGVAVFTLCMGILMFIMFGWATALMKMNAGGYVGGIIVMAVMLITGQDMANAFLDKLLREMSPVESVVKFALISEGAAVIISAVCVLILKVLYKKSYSKFIKDMAASGEN
ncbi:MAG: hypothetical protein NC078_02480 [Ruminococcus sp.]|nr:hypothetical protein [Ruminococcus sp.]